MVPTFLKRFRCMLVGHDWVEHYSHYYTHHGEQVVWTQSRCKRCGKIVKDWM